MKHVFIIITLFLFIGCETTAHQPHPKKHHEKYYQTKLCKKLDGIMEYRLKDRTRVDCLTDRYAIEVDFAKKWAESIGQSLYYSYMTNRQPAVGLICSKKDTRFIKRLQTVAKRQNIKIFILKK